MPYYGFSVSTIVRCVAITDKPSQEATCVVLISGGLGAAGAFQRPDPAYGVLGTREQQRLGRMEVDAIDPAGVA